ncbi:ABC transporter OS=Streptomyces canus OX=58343 GN=AQJ46_29010 PE=4 SV=1 [Streptomyces canus]
MIDAYEDPGAPDSRGGWRYLWWLVRCQLGRSAAGAVLASVWMVLLAATPCLMAKAIDEGLEPGDFPVLAGWSVALFAVGAFNAWLSIMRHRTMTRGADGRQLPHGHGGRRARGAAGRRAVAARGVGEVVTIGVGDVQTISQALPVVGPGWARSSPIWRSRPC